MKPRGGEERRRARDDQYKGKKGKTRAPTMYCLSIREGKREIVKTRKQIRLKNPLIGYRESLSGLRALVYGRH